MSDDYVPILTRLISDWSKEHDDVPILIVKNFIEYLYECGFRIEELSEEDVMNSCLARGAVEETLKSVLENYDKPKKPWE